MCQYNLQNLYVIQNGVNVEKWCGVFLVPEKVTLTTC